MMIFPEKSLKCFSKDQFPSDQTGSLAFILFIPLSQVDRFIPMLRVEVCLLWFPPGFPALPQYFNHDSVTPMSPHSFSYQYHIFEEMTSMTTD